MDLASIKIALLAGKIPPRDLLLRELRSRHAIILTQRHRKTIHNRDRVDMDFFPKLSQEIHECDKAILKQMPSSMETTAAAPRGPVLTCTEERTCMFDVASQENHGHQRCGQDFG